MKDTARELPEMTAIMPVYNMERYVERSLASAIAQTYPRLRLLVIDDGSTDRSLEICRRMAAAHPNIEVISGPNGGVAAARNHATELARSEYVAYLDGDDLWHPAKIARQVDALLAHPPGNEWIACYTLFRVIGDDDELLFNGASSGPRGAFFGEHLRRNHVGNGSSLLVRRDAALAVGGFDRSYAARGIGGCEDYDFQLKLLRQGKIELVPEFLVGYRLRSGQMSSDGTRMGRGLVAVVEKFADEAGLLPHERTAALASAHGFAASRALRSGDFRQFARSAAKVLSLAPLPGLGMGAKFVARQLGKTAGWGAPRGAGQAGRRTFESYDPSDGVIRAATPAP